MTGGEPRADGGATGDGKTRIGVDVGGTFTDVALSVDDRLVTAKVPTTDDQHVGVLEGIDKACDRAGITPSEIDGFAHAMTVSVNAPARARWREDGARDDRGLSRRPRDRPPGPTRSLRSRGREARPAGPSRAAVRSRRTGDNRGSRTAGRRADASATSRRPCASARSKRSRSACYTRTRLPTTSGSSPRRSVRNSRFRSPRPTRCSPSSASSSGRPRRPLTPTSDRRSTATSADWSRKPTRRGSRHRGSCRPTAASPTRRWSASAP